jgi:hypothetical protein
MSLAGLAKDTVAIVARGGYELPSGARVDIRVAVAYAIGNTRLFYPGDYDGLDLPAPAAGRPVIENASGPILVRPRACSRASSRERLAALKAPPASRPSTWWTAPSSSPTSRPSRPAWVR